MSASLLKRGLDLFKDDLEDHAEAKKKKKTKGQIQDPMSLIGTKKVGVKKELRKISQKQHAERMSKKRKSKTVHDEVAKYKQKDHTDASLDYINRLTKLNATKAGTTNKILDHHRGKLAKNQTPEVSKPESSSIFTDRDFEKFEEEYDWWSAS